MIIALNLIKLNYDTRNSLNFTDNISSYIAELLGLKLVNLLSIMMAKFLNLFFNKSIRIMKYNLT